MIKLAPFVGAVIAHVGAGLADTVILIVAVVTPPWSSVAVAVKVCDPITPV